ncbi:MAG: methyl-accepting chemotaxis protein [Acetatifactor sp.]
MKFSEKLYVNKVAITGHTIIDTVLVLAYALEVVKGSRTLGYYAIFALLCVAPVVAEIVIYRKDSESSLIQHIISISYGILYLFAIFTTTSLLTCTYAFPMFMVIILYMDVRCCALIFAGAFGGNVVYVIYHFLTVGYASTEIPDVEIRVACMLLTGIFMIMTSKAVKKVNEEKLKQIQEQTSAAEALTENILKTSEGMITEIAEVSDKVTAMGNSMGRMHDSMAEVSTGSSETAESVQKQLTRTEQIQSHIGKVKETAALIERSMENTAEKVSEGRTRMDELSGQVDKSMLANNQVLEQMKVLSEYTSQMNTIIETITSIANSTGMLALNASIEAARAGETGRGFAVVASQISGLANQTKSATVNITELIEHINRELSSVEKAVDAVTEGNRENTESARVVTENFSGIMEGTDSVGRQAGELLRIVEELEAANRDIVENIQTISAITEEVSAHANETYDACEENASLVDAVSGIVSNLNEGAQRLRSVR